MSVVAAPAQHMQAIARANHVRLARAALHREVAALTRIAGSNRLAELLLDPPDEMRTMRVSDALRWLDRVGHTEAQRILRGVHAADRMTVISEFREVGTLTARERKVLADYLRGGPS